MKISIIKPSIQKLYDWYCSHIRNFPFDKLYNIYNINNNWFET